MPVWKRALSMLCCAGSIASFGFAFLYRGGLFRKGAASFVVDWGAESLGLKLAMVALGTALLILWTDGWSGAGDKDSREGM